LEESIAALTTRENLDPGRRYRQPACLPAGKSASSAARAAISSSYTVTVNKRVAN